MMQNQQEQNTIPPHLLGYAETLRDYEREGRLRSLPADRDKSGSIDFVSNDYLGLGKKSHIFAREYCNSLSSAHFSASASRLLSRNQDETESLENKLGTLYRKEALLFNSGYHANVGAIQALNIPGTVFLCDKMIHASMIDGLSSCGAEWKRWKHNDIATLERLIIRNQDAPRLIVMVESIYSMDGDIAPLAAIVELKHRFPNVMLYVDEAHAFGVRGAQGLGVCEELGITHEADIIIGTFGKAGASAGAFAATSTLLKSILVNRARSFIFSTALPPVNHLWTSFMISRLTGMTKERERLRKLSEMFRLGLEEITGTRNISDSHIVPLILGDAHTTLAVARRLQKAGIDALPIRRPTVPPGGERIRFSISADMTEKNIIFALEMIREALADN